jgi:hypothetical protein
LIGTSSRIIKVVKTYLPFESMPVFLQEVVGYKFFQIGQANGRAHELGKLYGPESERQFWAKLDDLAHDLAELLNRVYQKDNPAKTNAAAQQAEAPQAAAPLALPQDSPRAPRKRRGRNPAQGFPGRDALRAARPARHDHAPPQGQELHRLSRAPPADDRGRSIT